MVRLGWFSNRTGTSVDDGARKWNNWLDQWQSGKLSTGSHVQSFPRAFQASTDVPVQEKPSDYRNKKPLHLRIWLMGILQSKITCERFINGKYILTSCIWVWYFKPLIKTKSHEKCKAFCARHHGKRGHERSEPVGAWGFKAIDKKGG